MSDRSKDSPKSDRALNPRKNTSASTEEYCGIAARWLHRGTPLLGIVMSSFSLASALGIIAGWEERAFAQSRIVPDNTLGAETSQVVPNFNGLPVEVIKGGAVRGSNLFHSFEEFNVAQGRGAYFFSPSTAIQNILARVTGSNPSQILGTLGTFGNSNPNLFLMNPNGIIFGSGASLDVGGSFVATTANSLIFANGTQFSATIPQTPPLLTISVPTGLQFGGNPGRILVQGDGQGLRTTNALIDTMAGLRVPSDQTLALVGGDIALEGGTLKTAGGRIELGSVAASSLVSLTPTNKGWSLGYQGVQNFGTIQLSGQSAVDSSGAGGGDIQVRGKRVTLQGGSRIESSNLASQPGGTLNVTASDVVELIGTSANGRFYSAVVTQALPGATQAGSNITIETRQLIVRDGGRIFANTLGAGRGGDLTVKAKDSVEVVNSPDKASGIAAQVAPRATGAGGNITLETGRLIVREGAQIGAGTFSMGAAGNLTVRAKDSVELIGKSADGRFASGLFSSVAGGATGAGGRLTIETEQLIARDGSAISTDNQGPNNGGDLTIQTKRLIFTNGAQAGTNSFGAGSSGNLTVTAPEFVELRGTSTDGQRVSGLFTRAFGRGDAGNLTINTARLNVQDGARVSASTFVSRGGHLSVTASDSVELSGTSADGEINSGLFTQTVGTGNAGSLRIKTGQLIVRDGAEVRVSATDVYGVGDALGAAGSIEAEARSIHLDNGSITATTSSGNGGNITLQAEDFLLMRHSSEISTSAGKAQAGGNGGNITITIPFIVAVPKEDSDITANAYTGKGGNIQVAASDLFGIQYRPEDTPLSDITASSTFGLQGTVQINTPGVDPTRGLANLPTNVPDVSNQIAQTCSTGGEKVAQNEFIVTGRGGLPDNPSDTLSSDAVWIDLRNPSAVSSHRGEKPVAAKAVTPQLPIVEANGWVMNEKGDIVLTASAPTITPLNPRPMPSPCHVSQTSRE